MQGAPRCGPGEPFIGEGGSCQSAGKEIAMRRDVRFSQDVEFLHVGTNKVVMSPRQDLDGLIRWVREREKTFAETRKNLLKLEMNRGKNRVSTRFGGAGTGKGMGKSCSTARIVDLFDKNWTRKPPVPEWKGDNEPERGNATREPKEGLPAVKERRRTKGIAEIIHRLVREILPHPK